MGTGTGKTLVAIRTLRTPCLIVCRRDDYLTWKEELREEGKPKPFIIEDGIRDPNALRIITEKVPSYTLVTYDLLKSGLIQGYLMTTEHASIVADEAHLIKRKESERTKTFLKVVKDIPQHIAMTGTPMTNKTYEDIFTQLLFADHGKSFGTNWWAFMKKWFIKDINYGGWFPRANTKSKFKEQMKQSCFHVDAEDVLDLPPRNFVLKSVPMSLEQIRYTEMVIEEWEIQISNGEVHELNYVMTQMLKLKQIASGFFYLTNEGEERKTFRLQNFKLAAVERVMLEHLEHNRKMVLWGSFDAELDMLETLCDENNIPSIRYHGTPKVKEQLRKCYFRDNTPIFICNVDAGVGMNELVVANAAGYFSNSYRSVSRTQSLGRIRRKGSARHKQITVYDFITEGSIDLKILRSVSRMVNLASEILASLKQGKPLRKVLTAA